MSAPNLRPEDIDRLGQALLTVTGELWVVKDRVRLLEQALIDAGVLPPDTVDKLQPDADLEKELETDRIALIDAVLKTLEPNT